MFVRYKLWDKDGIPAHKVGHNALEAVFLDENYGIADIRDKRLLEWLLYGDANRGQRYEIAYEKYGIFFNEKNQQVENDPIEEQIKAQEKHDAEFKQFQKDKLKKK